LLKARLQTAEKSFGDRLNEVDGQLQGIAREWDTAVEANTDATARKALMLRMNDSLNRRSYIRNLVTNVAKELGEI
jgi:hypothetical protein